MTSTTFVKTSGVSGKIGRGPAKKNAEWPGAKCEKLPSTQNMLSVTVPLSMTSAVAGLVTVMR